MGIRGTFDDSESMSPETLRDTIRNPFRRRSGDGLKDVIDGRCDGRTRLRRTTGSPRYHRPETTTRLDPNGWAGVTTGTDFTRTD